MQSTNARYRWMGDAFVKMARQEGLRTFGRGMPVMVVGAGPAHAMYFACYEKVKKSIVEIDFVRRNNYLAHGEYNYIFSQLSLNLCLFFINSCRRMPSHCLSRCCDESRRRREAAHSNVQQSLPVCFISDAGYLQTRGSQSVLSQLYYSTHDERSFSNGAFYGL